MSAIFVTFVCLLLFAPAHGAAEELSGNKAMAGDVQIHGIELGFDGKFKLGYWTPIRITLKAAGTATGALEVTLPDPDGVPTTVRSDANRPVEVRAGKTVTRTLYVKPGQVDGAIQVRFVGNQEVIAAKTFYPSEAGDGNDFPRGLPATARLLVLVGGDIPLADDLRRGGEDRAVTTHVSSLPDGSQLPVDSIGWDGVDGVLLFTSDVDLYRAESFPQAAAALSSWLEHGGRLYIFVGYNADELLPSPQPLSKFVPGRYVGPAALSLPFEIEQLCDSNFPIRVPRAAFRLPLSHLAQVEGRIAATGLGGNVPLVIRAVRGFGELTWVSFDVDRPPLAEWSGRPELFRRLIGTTAEQESVVASDAGKLTSLGYTDLVGQLRASLDAFPGIRSVSFAWVIGLTLLYVALLGPLDYLLVQKWGRRPVLTWLTLPIIGLLIGGGAYALGRVTKGEALRLNHAEIVDFDLQSNLVRGNVWTHLYTPRHDRFTLRLRPQLPIAEGEAGGQNTARLSWLGLPGSGLGGVEARADESTIETGYRYEMGLVQLAGLPLAVWSSKSLHGQWTAEAEFPLDANLAYDAEERKLVGTISHRLNQTLVDARIYHQDRVYPLDAIAPGQWIDLETTPPHRSARGHLTLETTLGKSAPPYDPAKRDTRRVLKTLMSYNLAGGASYVGLLNRYLGRLDFQHVLNSDRAVLVAETTHPGSQLMADGEPLSDEKGLRLVVYRVVIPVASVEN